MKKIEVYTEDLHAPLMRGFREGRDESFRAVFELLYQSLCMYAWKIAGDRALAEDIAGEALLKVWNRRAQFGHWLSLKHYLYVTVHNSCLNHLRKKQTLAKATPAMLAMLQQPQRNRLEHLIQTETYRELHAAIQQLPDQCRRVMILSYLEGRTLKEVASSLNMKVNSVKSQRNRGLTLLKKRLPDIFLLLPVLFS